MRERIRRHGISFKHALEGVVWALTTQPNYQIHGLISLIVIGLGVYLGVSRIEFAILISLVCIGFAIETINTAIERAADAIDTRWREDIKQTKDVAAGAMLIFSVGASIAALILFIPYLV